MEAGGFEPPSRNVSRQASTCLVAFFQFRLAERQTTGSQFSYFGKISPSWPEKTARAILLFGALTQPTGKAGQNELLN